MASFPHRIGSGFSAFKEKALPRAWEDMLYMESKRSLLAHPRLCDLVFCIVFFLEGEGEHIALHVRRFEILFFFVVYLKGVGL